MWHFVSATLIIRDSFTWKLAAKVSALVSKGISTQCSGLKPTASQPLPLPPYPLSTLHLVSIYSLSVCKCLCTSPAFPTSCTYLPLHLSRSVCFSLTFYLWSLSHISVTLFSTLSLLPPCPSLFLPLFFDLQSLWARASSRLPTLAVSTTPLWGSDHSTGSSPLASSRGKFSHVDWTWRATSEFLSVGLLKLTEKYPSSPPWSLRSFWKTGSVYVICLLFP